MNRQSRPAGRLRETLVRRARLLGGAALFVAVLAFGVTPQSWHAPTPAMPWQAPRLAALVCAIVAVRHVTTSGRSTGGALKFCVAMSVLVAYGAFVASSRGVFEYCYFDGCRVVQVRHAAGYALAVLASLLAVAACYSRPES